MRRRSRFLFLLRQDQIPYRMGVFWLLVFCFVSWGPVSAQDVAAPNSIKRGTLKTINDIVLPAYKSGNHAAFLKAMTPIVSRSSQKQLAEIESYCKTQGLDSVQGHFADLVITQVEQGGADGIEKLEMSVALYLAEAISTKVESGLGQIASHPVMVDPTTVSEDWKISEQLFWETHVYRNEFINAQRLVEFGVAVLKPHYRRAEKSEDPEKTAIFERVEKLATQVPESYQALVESEAEMRLIRFNRAHQKLHGQGDFETLLTSAMCVELDAEKLLELFSSQAPGSFSRAVLNDPGLPQMITTMVKTGREVGDDISTKAILFRSGLHFWLRGRYGEGPMALGLLKSPGAMQSKLAMEGLYMPKQRPKPISSYHGNEVSQPGYDRRHFQTWAVEYRPLMKSLGYERTGRKFEGTETISKAGVAGKFW